jgi:hypothetical protein
MQSEIWAKDTCQRGRTWIGGSQLITLTIQEMNGLSGGGTLQSQ